MIINPYKIEKPTPVEVPAQHEVATASALSNAQNDTCPKCGAKMGLAFLYNRTPVYYCDVDRVTHPKN